MEIIRKVYYRGKDKQCYDTIKDKTKKKDLRKIFQSLNKMSSDSQTSQIKLLPIFPDKEM